MKNLGYLLIISACVQTLTSSEAQAICKDATVSTESLLSVDIKDLMDVNVRTASKKQESASQAPAIMSIISCDEIDRFGGNNLTEVLERATSLYFTGSPTFAQNTISLRGDSPNVHTRHVLLLFDGRPIREGNVGGIVSPFLLSFPVNMVEQIEILRDPGSVLYGSNAYVGVINIIPKRPSKEGKEGLLIGKGGSFGTAAGEAQFFWKKDDADLSLAFNSFNEEGWNFKSFDNARVFSQGDYSENNNSVVTSGHYKNFHIDSFWMNSQQNTLGTNWPPGKTDLNWMYSNLGYNQIWNPQWHTEFNFTVNQLNGELTPNRGHAFTTANSSLIELSHFYSGGQWQGLAGATTNLMSGHSETKDSSGNVLLRNLPDYTNQWYTLYLQADYSIWKNLKLTTGGQAVKNGALNWKIVPRAGLIFQNEQGWSSKLLYGEAYRTAYASETNLLVPNVIKGNPNLTPETIQTFDAQLSYLQPHYQLAATYYHSLEEHLIIRTQNTTKSLATNINGPNIPFQGIELEGKAKLFDERLLLTSSLAYQGDAFSDQKRHTTIPDWLGKLGLSYNFDTGLSLGLFHNFSNRPHNNKSINPNVSELNPIAQPLNLMSLKLTADLKKYPQLRLPFKLNLYSYNLLNDKIYLPEFSDALINTIPQRSSRSFYFSVEYHFETQ